MTLEIQPVVPLAVVALVFVGVLATMVVPLLLRARDRLGRGRLVLLVTTGTVATSLAIAPLLGPSLERDASAPVHAIALLDASTSMTTIDGSAGRSRLEAAREALVMIERALPRVTWKRLSFANTIEDGHAEKALGARTALGDALARAGEDQDAGLVVVVSDGGSNQGSDPLAAARELSAQGTRVIAV